MWVIGQSIQKIGNNLSQIGSLVDALNGFAVGHEFPIRWTRCFNGRNLLLLIRLVLLLTLNELAFGSAEIIPTIAITGKMPRNIADNSLGGGPPPLPPLKKMVPSAPEQDEIRPSKAMARYQACLEQMVDTKSAGPEFMRSCLGVKKSRDAASEYETMARNRHQSSTNLKTLGSIPSSTEFLDITTIKTVLHHQTAKLQPCYLGYLARLKKSDPARQDSNKGSAVAQQRAQGTVEVKFVIRADGTIRNLRLLMSHLKEHKFSRCLGALVNRWKFPKASSGDEVYVHHGIDFSIKSGLATTTVERGYPATRGLIAIAPKDLVDAMNALNPKLQPCYKDLLKRQPSAKGKVAMHLMIDVTGQVRDVAYDSFRLGDGRFQDCLTEQAQSWLLPRPRNGQLSNTIAWPLLFDSTVSSRPPRLPKHP